MNNTANDLIRLRQEMLAGHDDRREFIARIKEQEGERQETAKEFQSTLKVWVAELKENVATLRAGLQEENAERHSAWFACPLGKKVDTK